MSQKKWNAIALFGAAVLLFSLGACKQRTTGTALDFVPSLPPTSGPSAEPHFDVPVPADAVSVEITVSDSVSGTLVDGTKLVVFDSADGKQVTHQLSVRNGKVTAMVSPKKKYNFVLLGKKGSWAGSMLQDYYVPEGGLSGDKSLMMLQFEHGQITRDVTPPISTR